MRLWQAGCDYYVMDFAGVQFLGRSLRTEHTEPVNLAVFKGPIAEGEFGFHGCNQELVGFSGGKRFKWKGPIEVVCDATECGPEMDILAFFCFRYAVDSMRKCL